jgi:hypothetical protein|tara:strand:+ start:642 stop:1313 length:672 start_codon:yes stop_codon:yes gene_type:complete
MKDGKNFMVEFGMSFFAYGKEYYEHCRSLVPNLTKKYDIDTYDEHWSRGQHLHIRKLDSKNWQEISIPKHINRYNATALIKHQDGISILLMSSESKKDGLIYTVHALDIKSKELKYLFSGHTLDISPDRRYVIYLSSKDPWAGYHPMQLYDIKMGRSSHVMSLWEVDPGSGLSFQYKWSQDSKAFLIIGATLGFNKKRNGPPQRFNKIYHLDTKLLYDIEVSG